MGKNQSASNLTNVIQVSSTGNVLFVSGSTTLMSISSSGAITTTGVISGSNALSASYAANADTLDGLDSTVFTLTSSFAAQTASFTAFTASFNAFSASIYTATSSFSGRVGALESYTSSLNAKTASFATTGSNNFIGTQTISGSVLQSGSFTTTGTLTAQTLVVQTITSSVDFVTGSTRFGSILGNTHVFTGSVSITGSLNATAFTGSGAGLTSIPNAALTNSTISGISLGSNLATLTIGTGLSGTSYNGSGAVTIANTITNNNQLTNGAGYITSAGTASAISQTIAAGSEGNLVFATIGTNDFFRIRGGGSSNAGWVELATADDGTEPIYLRQYTGEFASITRTATLLDGSGNTSFPGSVTATQGIFSSTVTLPNNTYLQFKDSAGTARTVLAVDASNSTVLRAATSGGTIAIQNYANTTNLLSIAESTGYTTLASPQITLGNDGGALAFHKTIGLDGQDYRHRYILLCRFPTFGNTTVNCGYRADIVFERTNGIGIDCHDSFDFTVSYGNAISFRQTSYQAYQSSLVQLPYGGVQYLALYIYSAPGYSIANISGIRTNYGGWFDANEYLFLDYSASQHTSVAYGVPDTIFKNNIVGTTLAGSGNRALYSDSTGLITNSSSDVTLKKNVENITYGLNSIMALRPIAFNWIPENLGEQKEIGFIAQEVQELIPEVIGINNDETLSLDYPKLTAVLVKAIQEINTKLDVANVEIEALKSR
jgi:hypothetical protein